MALEINNELLIACLAAIAAWFAALFAYWSYRVSRHALDLAELQHEATKTNFTAYLADSFRANNRKTKQGKYIFSIAYSNRSEANDSIAEVYLETFYVNSNNRVSHIITAHEEGSDDWLTGEARTVKLPIAIAARSSVTGWFVFSVPQAAEEAQRIEKYRVVAKNGLGEEISVESFILREIEYE